MIKQDILRRTRNGLSIYRLILKDFYPVEDPIQFTGNEVDLVKNPFNRHRKTLKITIEGGRYRHYDLELTDFKGGPFEFAALYYSIEGMPLYQILNHQLRLNLDVRYFRVHTVISPSPKPKSNEVPVEPKLSVAEFSFYRAPISNVFPLKNITLVEAYDLIRSDAYARVTRQLRSIDNPAEARAFKASQFNYATFSGVFTTRRDNGLSKHSGLVTIDFDHVPNVRKLKELLLRDEHIPTEMLFVSPSGDGLKWLIPMCDGEMQHSDFFTAVAKYISETYRLGIDKSGRDISRACFLPCDPDIYINPKYLMA